MLESLYWYGEIRLLSQSSSAVVDFGDSKGHVSSGLSHAEPYAGSMSNSFHIFITRLPSVFPSSWLWSMQVKLVGLY